jgi:hypothetical protein
MDRQTDIIHCEPKKAGDRQRPSVVLASCSHDRRRVLARYVLKRIVDL